MEWKQLRAECAVTDLDDVCAVMCMVDNGLMIEDYSDIATGLNTVYGELIDESILKADKTRAAVSIYIPEERNPSESVIFLRQRFSDLGLDVDLTVAGLREEEWATAWKQYYKPTHIGERLVVVPLWEDYTPAPEEVIVKMDPGMAFGTGTHETTRLVAAMLEKYVRPGDLALDLGSGSGILAIFAAKLGAKHVGAYDIDPVAVRVAKENASVNGCDNITCGESDLLAGVDRNMGGYNVITANIVADIIIRMSADISAYAAADATLITSGIISERADDVLSAMAKTDFVLIDRAEEKGWCALVFRKEDRAG